MCEKNQCDLWKQAAIEKYSKQHSQLETDAFIVGWEVCADSKDREIEALQSQLNTLKSGMNDFINSPTLEIE